MGGSGLEALWETVYVPNTDHVYARALRAHLLSSAATVSLLMDSPDCMSGIDLEHILETYRRLLAGTVTADDVESELTAVNLALHNQLTQLACQSRTARLWKSTLSLWVWFKTSFVLKGQVIGNFICIVCMQ